MSLLKYNPKIFIVSFILTTLLIFCVWWLVTPKKISYENYFLKQGFNFQSMRDESEGTGPKIGETIDLTKIYDLHGNRLSDSVKGKLLIIAVVDPDCPACESAQSDLHIIENESNKLGLEYFAVSFSSKYSSNEFSTYSKKIAFHSNFLIWKDETPAPNALLHIVTPSHIMVDDKGKVIYVWLGTSKDEGVRKRMRDQIIADTSLITSAVKVMSN